MSTLKTFFPVLFFSLFLAAQPKKDIDICLDAWHRAAADARYQDYFNLMSDDAVFVGTDPTENWTKDAFAKFAKPYFDKGRAWEFKCLQRNVYLSADGSIAWFDELLDTWMMLCRGSGVLRKINGQWKIAHYVLSVAIPNDHTNEVVQVKKSFDEVLIQTLKK